MAKRNSKTFRAPLHELMLCHSRVKEEGVACNIPEGGATQNDRTQKTTDDLLGFFFMMNYVLGTP